jgi:N-acetylmuramic acid 6-phosphate etherase
VEGAEDDEANGALAVDARNVTSRDLVIGISASGRAPVVRGALTRAREIGAKTILLTCNKPTRNDRFDLLIDLPTGPEILTGSTRLKAGTATKVALNIISTGAMVHLGRVRGNLMIDLQPTNKKLRARAVRFVSQLSGCDEKTARTRLERTDWNVRAALKE